LLGRHLLEGLVDNHKFARNRLKLLQHLRCRSRRRHLLRGLNRNSLLCWLWRYSLGGRWITCRNV
jgi:hypothetical protein